MTPTQPSRGYETFAGEIGRTMGESRPAWRPERQAPDGAPNIVVVLLDDLGFSDFSPYGSEIETPTIAGLADRGVTLTSYHTTPLCSPSRAALLTGLNPHRAGFAFPANLDPGFPSYAFELPDDAPTIAESLRESGYATFAVGKWHLTREGASGDAADRSSWPLQRGFDRYFGSLEGFTSLHAPHRLIWDNSPYDVDDYGDDYFLTDDLTDRAIGMVRSLRAHDARKPFFLYVAHHAVHGPIQAKPGDLAKYRGRYAAGWDHIREERFARQLAAGLFDETTVLPPRNHEPGRDVGPWDELTPELQERFARYMEVYAASIDNVDQNLARLLDVIEQYGELDNTIVVVTSDNGATSEGGPVGTRSYFSQFALLPELPPEWDRDVERDLDLIGGPRTTVHYPRGWGQASNTPFRLYKFDTLGGGVRAPFVLSWPRGLPNVGQSRLRDQFVNVTDVSATLLELAGVPRLAARAGNPAAVPDGVSAVSILRDQAAAPIRREQYGEMAGNRYYVFDSWKIVTVHNPNADYGDHEWQLYDLAVDPTETTDLSAKLPEVVNDLSQRWEAAAWWNTVFPLADHTPARDVYRPGDDALTQPVTLYPGTSTLERYRSSRLVQLRDVEIRVRLEFTPGDRGVLVAHGDQGGGYLLAVDDDRVWLSYNAYGEVHHSRALPLPHGPVDVILQITVLPEFQWQLRLFVQPPGVEEAAALPGNAAFASVGPVPQLLAMAPFTGISVGRDAGGPVDWELHEQEGQFPFTGRLHSVAYLPGRPADYDPREIAKVWAAGALALD